VDGRVLRLDAVDGVEHGRLDDGADAGAGRGLVPAVASVVSRIRFQSMTALDFSAARTVTILLPDAPTAPLTATTAASIQAELFVSWLPLLTSISGRLRAFAN
jgi:hypothetical protein